MLQHEDFLPFLKYPEGESSSNISKDLVAALTDQGHNLTVVTISEKKSGKQTFIQMENRVEFLRGKAGNMLDTVSKFKNFLLLLLLEKLIAVDESDLSFEKSGCMK